MKKIIILTLAILMLLSAGCVKKRTDEFRQINPGSINFDEKTFKKARSSLSYIRDYYRENNHFPSNQKFYSDFYLKNYPGEPRPIIEYSTYWDDAAPIQQKNTFYLSYFVTTYRDSAIGRECEDCGSMSPGCDKKYCIDHNNWQDFLDQIK